MGIFDGLRESLESARAAMGGERRHLLHKDTRGGEWLTSGQWTQHIEDLASEFLNPKHLRPSVFGTRLAEIYGLNQTTLFNTPELTAPIVRQLEYLQQNHPEDLRASQAAGLLSYLNPAVQESSVLTVTANGQAVVNGTVVASGISHVQMGENGTMLSVDAFARDGGRGEAPQPIKDPWGLQPRRPMTEVMTPRDTGERGGPT